MKKFYLLGFVLFERQLNDLFVDQVVLEELCFLPGQDKLVF